MPARRMAWMGLLWLTLVGLSGAQEWKFRVRAATQLLAVEAEFPAGSEPELALPEGLFGYVEALEQEVPGGWQRMQQRGDSWFLQGPGPYHIRYRFALTRAARAVDNPEVASLHRGVVVTNPTTFLLRPQEWDLRGDYTLHVETGSGVDFRCGVTRVDPGSYRASIASLDQAAAAVVGRFETRSLQLPGGRVELVYLPGALKLPDEQLVAWVERTGRGVADYFGKFPVPNVLLVALPRTGADPDYIKGSTLAGGGASLLMLPSDRMTAADLLDSWTLCHELCHLAFPGLAWDHHWLEEGLSTYVEPVIRLRLGQIGGDRFWVDLIQGLPQGIPPSGGLDGNHGWGETYWGGALYWFVADLQIREGSRGRLSLQDCLRALNAQGGNLTQEWSVRKTLTAADSALPNPVLGPLYQKSFATGPIGVDLNALWRRLGVSVRGGRLLRQPTDAGWLRDSFTSRQENR